MHLLLIGGSGFLSGTVARLALAQGHRVTIVTRGQRPAPAGVEMLQVDRQDRVAFSRLIAASPADWDLVVDAIPYSPDDARQDVEVFAGRTGRLVFVSTDFIYDPTQRMVPQPEEVPTYAREGYGGLKRSAEIVLHETAPASLPWTILRPAHIYGPGSLPGCLPLHGRDPHLIQTILAEKPLRLLDGGRLLQHPIFAPDLAETILSAATDPASADRILNVAGPDIIESRVYYQVLGELLNREVRIEEVPVADFLQQQPEQAPFCCERVYDLTALRATGLSLPATPLRRGLEQLLDSLPQK